MSLSRAPALHKILEKHLDTHTAYIHTYIKSSEGQVHMRCGHPPPHIHASTAKLDIKPNFHWLYYLRKFIIQQQ